MCNNALGNIIHPIGAALGDYDPARNIAKIMPGRGLQFIANPGGEFDGTNEKARRERTAAQTPPRASGVGTTLITDETGALGASDGQKI